MRSVGKRWTRINKKARMMLYMVSPLLLGDKVSPNNITTRRHNITHTEAWRYLEEGHHSFSQKRQSLMNKIDNPTDFTLTLSTSMVVHACINYANPMSRLSDHWKMVEKSRRILILASSPFFFLFLLSLLYLGEFGSQVVPSNQGNYAS